MIPQELIQRYNNGEHDFRGKDLRYANLAGANLKDTDLWGVDLREAALQYADLRHANLRGANLTRADLQDADLQGADLRYADLQGADLRKAKLQGADLRKAKLQGANLSQAYLQRANLAGANLRDADLRGTEGLPPLNCPEEGAFVGFKKVQGGSVIKLRIPASAKRVNAYGSRKCRADHVFVLEGSGIAIYDQTTRYIPGRIVVADGFCDDLRVECAQGIHFFLTRQEAEAY